ncbi:MAG: YbaB/EbfC family nucleoid-associated protein, partial [Cyanobacteriota bacterium]|nr:YbaB/EbfC family nucleoid-associated protein [Cyanobacteriota bacterium]
EHQVKFQPDGVLGEGAEVVSAMVLEAMQAAYENSTSTMRQRMEELTGGLNLPGM